MAISEKYAVVEFFTMEPKEVEVVSTKWLLNYRSMDKCMVHWPPCRSQEKIRKLVKEGAVPNGTWSRWEIRVLYTTDDYNKAERKCSRSMETSDLNTTGLSQSDDDDDVGPSQLGKRTRRPNPRFMDFEDSHSDVDGDDDDDDDGDNCINVSSKSGAASRKKARLATAAASTLKDAPTIRRPSDTRVNTLEGATPERSTLVRSTCLTRTASPVPRPDTAPLSQREVLIKIEEVKIEVRDLKHMLRSVLQRLQQNQDNANTVDPLPEDVQFPMDSVESLDDLEAQIKRSQQLRNSLVVHLGKAGGPELRQSVTRIMQTIVTGTLAVMFNWCGQRGEKKGFQKRYSELVKVICDAVRRTRQLEKLTDGEIENEIKRFLKYVGQKINYRNKTGNEVNEMGDDDANSD